MLHYLPLYYHYIYPSYNQLRLYCAMYIFDPIYNRPCMRRVLSARAILKVRPSLFKPCKCRTPVEVDSASKPLPPLPLSPYFKPL